MRGLRYVLEADGVTAVEEPDIRRWGQWFEDEAHRILARTTVGELVVCTDFLAVNQNLGPDGPPILWETMISGRDGWLGYQEQYTSHAAALAGHAAAVLYAQAAQIAADAAAEVDRG
jgi:hypothetical protein